MTSIMIDRVETTKEQELAELEALLDRSSELEAEFDFVTMSIADREVNMVVRC